ncbi:Outer membrane protein beta-barrel domain-containing protein [Tenacibaculum sp. 190524A02b]|uniref:Outer membrane protein beta-barrel domain-containing protein n=1 Tax=Tenacibaculum vairaonense TaxID=3137860 RepID=A0ABM9PH61_9FLAO
MNYRVVCLLLFVSFCGYSQKDSLQIGDAYFEDQLYMDFTYNVLYNQPEGFKVSSFSYGISMGYIKDIPLKRSGKLALGVGLGYGYDSFNHSIYVIQENNKSNFFPVLEGASNNKLRLHNIEMPIQIRFRTSDAKKYSFWRLYAGIKLIYNVNNRFTYDVNNVGNVITNLNDFNKWQMGLTMSAGYSAFNFYIYYGLTPLFKNVNYNGAAIDTKYFKLGLSFFLL